MPDSVGPYQIVGLLGAGGMGEVFRALDPRVGREVALKLLPESMAADTDRRRRFEQEARLAASLNHPNVMAIYDVGLADKPPYIVSELVPGESLRVLIGKGPVPLRKAVDLAAQIASGLAAAHAAGIVHRDLKPENVIVTPEGTAKILDFGVARLESKNGATAAGSDRTMTQAHTSAGSVVGTASYVSPEQARAQDVDYRSDQFSLGLVLYEMLSGKQAFERPSAVQTMSAIVEDEPATIERPLPAQLRWLLNRCLAKERHDRYESTRDLARELAQLRDHASELTTAQSGVQAAVAAPHHYKRWMVAGAAIAAAAAAWCAAQLLRPERSIDLSMYKLTPFATALPAQSWPVWSPDGKSIAFFGATESSDTHVYVQRLDAAMAVELAGGDVTAHSWNAPFWSPDSSFIYFRCSKGDEDGLCRAPTGGGGAALIQRDAQASTLSPDGRTLAMLVGGDATGFRLRLMTASPPEATPSLYDPQPFPFGTHYNNPSIAFAPDGKRILIAIAFEGRGETAYLAPWPPGPARPPFPQGFAFQFTPQISWMPDSRYFVFSDTTGAQSQIYMADSRDGRTWPVLREDRGASAPSVSPDGTRLAYVSSLSQADVISVPLDPQGAIRTVLGSFRTEQMADASPASQQVVYVTDRRGTQEVWITSLAEDWERPLFTPENFQVDGAPAQFFLDPVFSPDGKRVAVAAKGDTQIHVYTAFASGGTAVRATSGDTDLEDAPTWSPDGNWIAFFRVVDNSLKLSKVRPGSGEPPVDLGVVQSNPVPVWSPDGAWIAASGPQGIITLFSPDGKPSVALPAGGDGGPLAWAHDGKSLYHVHRDPPELSQIDIATRTDKKVRDLPGLAPYSAWNPGMMASVTMDCQHILYTVNRPRQEIWILDGIQEPRPWYKRLLGK